MAQRSTDRTKTRTLLRLRTLDPMIAERHASWLELFFDLVFVLAVSQVARTLSQNTDVVGLLKYIALFAGIWWSWVGFTYYADRFETNETVYRILMFAGMLAVTGLSLTLGGAFSPQGDVPFIICYSLVLLVLSTLYLRAAYHIPLARAYCLQFTIGLGSAVGLLLISLAFEGSARYTIWAAALVLEFVIPFLNVRLTRAIPIDRSHIPERFGLFTIIVLGEAVIGTANSAAVVEWTSVTILSACLAFAMAACFWWINFEFVEDSAAKSPALLPRFIYIYGHFLIVASIVAVSVGAEHAIKESLEPHLHLATLALLACGTAVFLLAITIIRLVTGVCNLIYPRLITIGLLLLIWYFGRMLPPLAVIAPLLALVSAMVWLEARYGEDEKESKAEDESTNLRPCEHAGEMQVFNPREENGCEECRKNNYKWVHLRLCLICGHTGCCDSSVHKHATKHFHRTGHPVIASLEPGEHWAWCYEDERFVPLNKRVRT